MPLQVLAMARPWQENLLKHSIPQAFQDAGIGMVLNLQVTCWHGVNQATHCLTLTRALVTGSWGTCTLTTALVTGSWGTCTLWQGRAAILRLQL